MWAFLGSLARFVPRRLRLRLTPRPSRQEQLQEETNSLLRELYQQQTGHWPATPRTLRAPARWPTPPQDDAAWTRPVTDRRR